MRFALSSICSHNPPINCLIETDSSEAFKLITQNCLANQPYKALVKEIAHLADKNEEVLFCNIYREANKES